MQSFSAGPRGPNARYTEHPYVVLRLFRFGKFCRQQSFQGMGYQRIPVPGRGRVQRDDEVVMGWDDGADPDRMREVVDISSQVLEHQRFEAALGAGGFYDARPTDGLVLQELACLRVREACVTVKALGVTVGVSVRHVCPSRASCRPSTADTRADCFDTVLWELLRVEQTSTSFSGGDAAVGRCQEGPPVRPLPRMPERSASVA
ncbi:hypothetical protein ADK35_02425 [Streptomyces viridochromogenes]|nr:hypothetical protein ADK35_02425 [Streptomyces viridochromogenes]